jgi:hypothetical protein
MSSSTNKDRAIMFKGTISVSIVYGVVSLLLLGVIYYSEMGQEFVQESNFPFAISFTIGMLVVIVFLVYKVLHFKQELAGRAQYDDTTCPEFWKLRKATERDLTVMAEKDITDLALTNDQLAFLEFLTIGIISDALSYGNMAALTTAQQTVFDGIKDKGASYVLNATEVQNMALTAKQLSDLGLSVALIDENVANKVNPLVLTDPQKAVLADIMSGMTAEQKKGKEYICYRPTDSTLPLIANESINTASPDMNIHDKEVAEAQQLMYEDRAETPGNVSTVRVRCSELYPVYMSRYDVKNNPDSQNLMRCAYANKCGLSWSAVCQNSV